MTHAAAFAAALHTLLFRRPLFSRFLFDLHKLKAHGIVYLDQINASTTNPRVCLLLLLFCSLNQRLACNAPLNALCHVTYIQI